MIHSAIMGSIERFTAVLLEHTAGILPLWLSPVQVAVLPVGETHEEYARTMYEKLKNVGIRAELSVGDSLGKRIRAAKLEKIPYTLVVGDKEVESNTVTAENNRNGDKASVSLQEFITATLECIRERANI